MSIHHNIEEWLRKMGYNGKIPDSLQKICNPSTVHIWEQLISKIKPKQEVAHFRNNIIVNRLQKHSLDSQNEVTCPIKEIQVYCKKQGLEKKVERLEKAIEEKQTLIEKIAHNNKVVHVQISHMKAEIKEIEQKKFLLEKEIIVLEEEFNVAQETFFVAVNERDGTRNVDNIIETLNKCTDKIERKTKTAKNICKENASSINNKSVIHIGTKRESLGLLPQNLLNWSDEFDGLLETSVKYDVSVNGNLISSSASLLNIGNGRDCINELCNVVEVQDILKNLLHMKSRKVIAFCWENIYESLLSQVRTLKFDNKFNSSDPIDLTELYVVHIKTELEKDKLRIILKKLQEANNKRKEEVFASFSARLQNETEEHRKIFELQIEEAGLVGANNFLRKRMESSVKENICNELQVIKKKISQTKNEITIKLEYNENIIERTKDIFQLIKETQNESFLELRKLNAGMSDPHIINAIEKDIHAKEIEVFCNFPLEFNKQLNNKYVNVYSSTVPSYIDLGENNAEKVVRILDIPFSPAEDIVLNLLQSKVKLNYLKALEPLQQDTEKVKHKQNDFEPCEEYLDDVINKLMTIKNSNAVKQVLRASDYLKEVHKIAEEKPWRNIFVDKTD